MAVGCPFFFWSGEVAEPSFLEWVTCFGFRIATDLLWPSPLGTGDVRFWGSLPRLCERLIRYCRALFCRRLCSGVSPVVDCFELPCGAWAMLGCLTSLLVAYFAMSWLAAWSLLSCVFFGEVLTLGSTMV